MHKAQKPDYVGSGGPTKPDYIGSGGPTRVLANFQCFEFFVDIPNKEKQACTTNLNKFQKSGLIIDSRSETSERLILKLLRGLTEAHLPVFLYARSRLTCQYFECFVDVQKEQMHTSTGIHSREP